MHSQSVLQLLHFRMIWLLDERRRQRRLSRLPLQSQVVKTHRVSHTTIVFSPFTSIPYVRSNTVRWRIADNGLDAALLSLLLLYFLSFFHLPLVPCLTLSRYRRCWEKQRATSSQEQCEIGLLTLNEGESRDKGAPILWRHRPMSFFSTNEDWI